MYNINSIAAVCLCLCSGAMAVADEEESVRLAPHSMEMVYPGMREYMWNGAKEGTQLGFICMAAEKGVDVIPGEGLQKGKSDLTVTDSTGHALGVPVLSLGTRWGKKDCSHLFWLHVPQCPSVGAAWVEVSGRMPLALTCDKAESKRGPLAFREGAAFSAKGFDVTVKSVKEVSSAIVYGGFFSGNRTPVYYGPTCCEVVLSYKTKKPLEMVEFKFFKNEKEALTEYETPYKDYDYKRHADCCGSGRDEPGTRKYYFVKKTENVFISFEYKKKKAVVVPVVVRFHLQAVEQKNQ